MGLSVLVVESESLRLAEIGGWLEEEGFDVLACPGPQAPRYSCLATCGAACPLAEAADVVVLDMQLASDVALEGTTGWELLVYYMEHGERIVALSGGEDSVRPHTDQGVIVLQRPVQRKALMDAVRGLTPQPIRGDGDGHDPAD